MRKKLALPQFAERPNLTFFRDKSPFRFVF